MLTKNRLHLIEANIKKLDIPIVRKQLNVQNVRWILRSQPKISDEIKILLVQWLRDNP